MLKHSVTLYKNVCFNIDFCQTEIKIIKGTYVDMNNKCTPIEDFHITFWILF